ncbi:LytTR family DNA-binding domain-containing protein [Vagococcus intermedius]|uniref:LytTR family transcriptional regulator n=1 Tax=Vagococcus intermedius TaxID=2991418 RepID=A0AAF0I4W3_9ENTE|nr:LytTR family DNA-binding domain-containing protein [Vagococcus intermedius]WEG72583.1 LytTR family transcriptional regulator [Vagococcus intermedius]WEG74670.1 LytTR family transcriptional regulator [Vagococcus intermedius]
MKIVINKILEKLDIKESAIFNIFEVTPSIEKAISFLEESNYTIVAQNIDSEEFIQLKISDILYIEYLERRIFLYTKNSTLITKDSLSNFSKILPNEFVQISKSTVANSLYIKAFIAQKNGNLTLEIVGNEKLIVSRRYVANVKKTLQNISN